MKAGWWLLVTSFIANIGLMGAVAYKDGRIQGLRKEVARLQEENGSLTSTNAALRELKDISLQVGRKPVRISGTLWVVVER